MCTAGSSSGMAASNADTSTRTSTYLRKDGDAEATSIVINRCAGYLSEWEGVGCLRTCMYDVVL